MVLEGTGSGASPQPGDRRKSPTTSAAASKSGTGTNPEELIAAAHAGCFSMALSAVLGEHL